MKFKEIFTFFTASLLYGRTSSQYLHSLVIKFILPSFLTIHAGVRLMLNTLTCALSGNYVNFGVFNLYDDKALQNSFDVALQVCLQIPLSDVLAYVKLSKAYFAFLEVLFRNHLDVLCGLESPVFIQLVKTNLEGLQSNGMFSIITVKAVLLLPF